MYPVQAQVTIADVSCSGTGNHIRCILFRPFGFRANKDLNYLAFQYFDYDRTWGRLYPETCRAHSIRYTFLSHAYMYIHTHAYLISYLHMHKNSDHKFRVPNAFLEYGIFYINDHVSFLYFICNSVFYLSFGTENITIDYNIWKV